MTEKELIKKVGVPYSVLLDIDLESKKEKELFKWFFAALLFGKRISEKIAIETYKIFNSADLIDPEKLKDAGWDKLVELLDEGGYTRYDYSTATKILNVCEKLLNDYGSLSALYKKSSNSDDLFDRLDEFYGVGPVTIYIFLRELRKIWPKSDAEISDEVKKAAKRLHINLKDYKKRTKKFIRLECALHRYWKSIK